MINIKVKYDLSQLHTDEQLYVIVLFHLSRSKAHYA
jgi:hypothetical protein